MTLVTRVKVGAAVLLIAAGLLFWTSGQDNPPGGPGPRYIAPDKNRSMRLELGSTLGVVRLRLLVTSSVQGVIVNRNTPVDTPWGLIITAQRGETVTAWLRADLHDPGSVEYVVWCSIHTVKGRVAHDRDKLTPGRRTRTVACTHTVG